MLREIQVANVILIPEGRVSFAAGLNVVSGASGSGKTILVKALGLLAGERASADLIGPFGRSALVEGSFLVEPGRLRSLLENAAPLAANDAGELAALRTLDAEGDNRCYLNGRSVPLQAFRSVMAPLIEIAGQEGSRVFADAAERAWILDRCAGTAAARVEFGRLLDEARGAEKRLAALRAGAAELRERTEFIAYEIAEIGRLGLEKGELGRLEADHRLLSAVEETRAIVAKSRLDLYEGDDSAADRIGSALRALEGMQAAGAGRVRECAELLRNSLAAVQEAAFILRDLCEQLDADPERLARLEARLAQVRSGLARFGPTEADLFERLNRLQEEQRRLTSGDESVAAVEAELAAKAAALDRVGRRLDAGRRKAATRLAQEVKRCLDSLLMPEAGFAVELEEPEWDRLLAAATANGPGPVRFLVAPNPGTKPAPVDRIASGGERSRILLALLGSLGRYSGIPVMVFDEIDESVGSRLGDVVGDMLLSLARTLQVIAVSHLPAIAGRGRRHFKMEKTITKRRASVAIRPLAGDARVRELAEMLAGPRAAESAVTEAVRILRNAGAE